MGSIVATGLGGLGVAVALVGVGFVVSFRNSFVPVQDAIRRMNRSFVNPRALETAGRPDDDTAIVEHAGRRTGTAYRTPVVAVPIVDGFVIALPYGPRADWVRNVFEAGEATLVHRGRRHRVVRPMVVAGAVVGRHFSARERWMQRAFGVDDFLVVRGSDLSHSDPADSDPAHSGPAHSDPPHSGDPARPDRVVGLSDR